MSSANDDLSKQVTSWITQDPDMKTRNQLIELLTAHQSGESESSAELSNLFSGRLAFGTAGIRGPIRPGPSGMNRVVIGQTTAGLARYLLENRDTSVSRRLLVVVGCDARTNSDVFASDTASILSGHGIDVIQLADALPTPVLAFAVRHLGADAGVMVTASHNPPEDNGYKVYLGGIDEGSQIIPPVDAKIEAHILDVARTLPWNDIPNSPDNVTAAPESLVSDYIAGTLASVGLSGVVHEGLQAVYTPLHGVGEGTFLATVEAAGMPAPDVVAAQARPDAAFPTVAFPNPEEKGALDLSFELAREITADLIIANDPDADRLAVALPDDGSPAGYSALTGNQVGAILGWHMAERAAAHGQHGALSNSLVSSPVLGKIATHFGLTHVETLTGFKYVSRVPNLIFGFEEALGFLVTPDVVRDKDGISAGLMILDLAHRLASEGQTLWNYLDGIEGAVGGFCSSQITIRLDAHSSKAPLGNLLRSEPPTHFGLRKISKIDDFLEGVADYPQEDILRYYLEDDSRVIVRPSGTEPKLKIYLDTTGTTHLLAQEALTELERNVKALLSSIA
jgi:phosphomannomutase